MFLKTLHDYWWAYLAYWLVGVIAYFLMCWWDKKHYGVFSINSLWEDLLCAAMLGILWPAIGAAVSIVWAMNKIEDKTGIFINFQCLMGIPVFGYFVFYNIAGLLHGFNLLNVIGLLFFGLLLHQSIRGLTVRPTGSNILSWVKKDIEAKSEKFKQAVEEQKRKKENP